MKKITVKKGQSLMDIAVQEYGSIEGVFDLVTKNNLKGITSNVYEGDALTVGEPINVRNAHLLNDIATITQAHRATGIGFWRINHDFKVKPKTNG